MSRNNPNWLTLIRVMVFASLLFPLSSARASEVNFGGVTPFHDLWIKQDQLVGSPGLDRPYTWGPNVPNTSAKLTEPYQQSPNYQRQILYLDKARMELNQPSTGLVTTGLLVKELVSGLRQDGDNTFLELAPSQTQVAGDSASLNPDAPTYASFKNVVTLGNADTHSKPWAVGQLIDQSIAKDGTLATITPSQAVRIGAYESQTGHNIAAPFEDFMQLKGPLTDPATNQTINDQLVYTSNPTSNVFGLAISEPLWVKTKVAGVERVILVQLFERRVLTYNPALPINKVEFGNIGQHYYRWRYVEDPYLAELPDYPNGIQANPTNLGEAGLSVLAQKGFETTDSQDQRIAFYQNKLSSSGWHFYDRRTPGYYIEIYNKGDTYLEIIYGGGCGPNLVLLLMKKIDINFNC